MIKIASSEEQRCFLARAATRQCRNAAVELSNAQISRACAQGIRDRGDRTRCASVFTRQWAAFRHASGHGLHS